MFSTRLPSLAGVLPPAVNPGSGAEVPPGHASVTGAAVVREPDGAFREPDGAFRDLFLFTFFCLTGSHWLLPQRRRPPFFAVALNQPEFSL